MLCVIAMESLINQEYRCVCGKLLFKGYIVSGALETKCPRCHTLTTVGDSLREPGRYAFLLDRDASIVNATHTAAEVLGYPLSELIGKHYYDISKAMSRALYERVFDTLMKQSVKKIHYQHGLQVRKDGGVIPVDVRFRMTEENGKPVILCICNPGLSQREGIEVFGTDIADVCDGYAEVNPDRMFTLVSEQLKNLLGYEQEEMVGRAISDFVYHLEDAKEQRDRIAQIKSRFDSREPFRVIDSTLQHKEGRAVVLSLYFMPTFDEEGVFGGYRVLIWTSGPRAVAGA